MSTSALVLANGQPPTRKTLKRLLADASFFVCADGGANTAARYGLKPAAIVGDMDSIQSLALRRFRNVDMHKDVDDYSTDLEKSLAWVTDKGYNSITVVGATGGRLDHFIGNLSAMVKFSPKASITFIDDAGEWIFVDRSKDIHLPVRATVSLIPLSRCDGIVTKGLRWNLNYETLELGIREATSNVVDESPVHISVAKGNLILFHLFKPAVARKSHPAKKRRRR